MGKLVVFWGGKDDLSFTWWLSEHQPNNQSVSSDSLLETYQLESHEILKADLNCLANMAEQHSVSLVLSSTDVAIAQVAVPNKTQRLLRKAVPYMLEDEVATSVDDLFFAFADKMPNNQLSVRAIERKYLEAIIESFKAAEIKLTEIVTDIDLISSPTEGIKLMVGANSCLSIDADNKRWYCHPDDFNWLIQKQISNEDADDELAVAIPMNIYSEQEMDSFIHKLPVGRFAAVSHHIEDVTKFLLQENQHGINLLQAEYEVQKESSQFSGFLSKVATLAGFILLTHLLYQGANIYALSEKKAQLDAQKHTLYKQAFPAKRKIRNPYKAMKGDVSLLGNSDGGGFLNLLDTVSEQLTDVNQIKPTNISYESVRDELRMDVIASDLVVLDQYADALRTNGHTVEKSSETQRGDGYSSRLTIRY